MHRISGYFSEKHKIRMDSKLGKFKPKLQRLNAVKDIDYELPSTSSYSDDSSALRTQSLGDLSPFGDKKSFRVQGNEGEFEIILKSLGLSGIEDFSIPAAAWEAMKFRSSSDVLPRSRGLRFDSPKEVDEQEASELSGKSENNARVRVNDVIERRIDSVESYECCSTAGVGDEEEEIRELSDKLQDSITVSETMVKPSSCVGGGRGGIKGVRPPVLAPPPSISMPVTNTACSTWDILRSFAPDWDGSSGLQIPGEGFCSDEDEEEGDETSGKREAEGNCVRLRGNGVLSESCSFTTSSNDDDSSSSTTEPMSNISPNGRFRRIITYWEKGELLGRGSFGSVYEGIAE
ncbi:unnamed protein product [Ilex paraguariensis]|uniref:Mitogen-activated protein kinase kinase kinase 1 n=1 Tax=Ilex paraguariensis TaxID=185542 RepID=A0ABC8TQI6_9AQUA